MRKEETLLGALKREQTFFYKHGRYQVINMNHPNGIECKLITGSIHNHKKGLQLLKILKRKLKKSLPENHLILPRKTVVRMKFDKKKVK